MGFKIKKPWSTDAFGNAYFVKRALILTVGYICKSRYTRINKSEIKGAEHLANLPDTGVLFVSNHQTYFAEVILMYYVFSAAKNKKYNDIRKPWFLFNPRLNLYFIAAVETMKSGLLPKLFAYAGSVSIKRTWRAAGQAVNRQVDMRDFSKIKMALDDGWVITFPQGTTKPYVKGRRGTAHVIKRFEPIVVPIVIDGFRRAFDKKGLKLKKRGTTLKMTIKEPLKIDYSKSNDEILDELMHAIEQSETHAGEPLGNP